MAENVVVSFYPVKANSDACGMTLIEVLIALAIMGLVSIVFLGGMQSSYRANTVNQERVIAEDLAKYQLEYVKGQAYDSTNNPPQYQSIQLLTGVVPTGYYVQLISTRLDPKGDGTGNDDGLQEITIKVFKGSDASGSLLITVKGYKIQS
jgi:prepilin-type N-terminal cleavage/methylation domain-containing protein